MKLSAENDTQTRESSTLNSDMQNITNLPKPSTTANHLDSIVAATIFIVLLLGLYTILWKCMSFQAKRYKGHRRSRQKIHHPAAVSC